MPRKPKAPTFRQRVIAALDPFGEGRVTAKKDGTFELRNGYFYRMGHSPDKTAANGMAALRAAGFEVVVTDRGDHWAAWPKPSYMWARFRVTEPQGDDPRLVDAPVEAAADGVA